MKWPFLFLLAWNLLSGCNRQGSNTIKLAGNAQGTTWHITYLSRGNANYKPAIDSIFKKIDSSLSTYIPASIISRVNNNDTSVIVDDYFMDVFSKSIEISEKTNGYFDVTVAPLINALGFGPNKKTGAVDSLLIDSLLAYTGYKKLRMQGSKLVKKNPGVMLNFNAIAQGYTVDVLAAFFEGEGIENYLVEVGGEVKARGKNGDDQFWTIGIDQPTEITTDGRPLKAIIQLKDKALATSGNYRKYYIENGKKYAHIIDPFSGYPAKHNLLSATVIADDCMTADAYATAFRVMGLEKSKQFIAKHKKLNLEVFFILDNNGAWETYASETLRELIQDVP